MLTVALSMAVIGLVALVAAMFTGIDMIAWVSIAAGAFGGALLISDTLRARQRRAAAEAAQSEGTLAFDEDFPDARPAVDAPSHSGDHTVQREILREERVVHPDTGPLNPDTTREEVVEAIRHRRHR